MLAIMRYVNGTNITNIVNVEQRTVCGERGGKREVAYAIGNKAVGKWHGGRVILGAKNALRSMHVQDVSRGRIT
jgi:hypothetical protein